MSRFLLVLPLFLLDTLLTGCKRNADDQPSLVVISGATMGTYYRVNAVVNPDDPSKEELHNSIQKTLNHINRLMSTYLPDSEISQFNQSNQTDWFPVSDDTAFVVDNALKIFHQSDGAFDITVAPLIELWGFGRAKGRPAPPTALEIEAAMRHVGSDHLEVQLDPPSLRKSDPKLQIDLSAIAKGFAVDQITIMLEQSGIDNCLVDIGGEIRALGRKPGNNPWMVGIESPNPDEEAIQRTLPLDNRALATSGDYRNYLEFEGKRYSHEIDPRTGYPIEHDLVSASVMAGNCMTADAWATALMILGPAPGTEVTRRMQLPALLITKKGLTVTEFESPNFIRYFPTNSDSE